MICRIFFLFLCVIGKTLSRSSVKVLSYDTKSTSCIDAHGCEMSFFASQNASGAKKVCFLTLNKVSRVCEAHFLLLHEH